MNFWQRFCLGMLMSALACMGKVCRVLLALLLTGLPESLHLIFFFFLL